MHVPSSMGNVIASNITSVFIAANAGAYLTTASPVTTVATITSNREQENTIGNEITRINYNITMRPSASSAISICVLKVERAAAVPVLGTGLPTQARIVAVGLQTACREAQPGRVIHYSKLAAAPEQPVIKTIVAKFGKFKMSKIRTGDFYVLMVHNDSAGTLTTDFEARYKELK